MDIRGQNANKVVSSQLDMLLYFPSRSRFQLKSSQWLLNLYWERLAPFLSLNHQESTENKQGHAAVSHSGHTAHAQERNPSCPVAPPPRPELELQSGRLPSVFFPSLDRRGVVVVLFASLFVFYTPELVRWGASD